MELKKRICMSGLWRNSGTVFLCSTCKYALDWYIWPLCHVSVLCHCLAHERHISETPVKFKVAPVFFNLHCTGSSRMTYVTFNANRTACSFLVEWGKKNPIWDVCMNVFTQLKTEASLVRWNIQWKQRIKMGISGGNTRDYICMFGKK